MNSVTIHTRCAKCGGSVEIEVGATQILSLADKINNSEFLGMFSQARKDVTKITDQTNAQAIQTYTEIKS